MTLNIAWELLSRLFTKTAMAQYTFAKWDSITVRLTVNTSRFLAGSLILSYLPGTSAYKMQQLAQALTQSSFLLFDASKETFIEFDIPYVASNNAHKITDDPGYLGKIVLAVFSKLFADNVADGSATVDWNLEAKFNNFRLFGQTIYNALPAYVPPATFVIVPNAFWDKAQGAPKAEAVKKSELGVISGPAETVGQIASVVKSVPLVGEFAAVVELGARAVSGIAQWFGLSRPVDLSSLQLTKPVPMDNLNHLHGLAVAECMSTRQDMEVACEARLVRSACDEMDMSVHIRQPAYLQTVAIPSTKASGTLITQFPVTPLQYFRPSMTATGIFGTPLGYIAAMFKQWRGSMEYSFLFPATQMRRMRVAICWTLDPITSYSTEVMQRIVSLDGTTQVDFSVPWQHSKPYRYLGIPTSNANLFNSANGYITVFVLSALTGALTQDVIIHSRGGTDLQFAVFSPPSGRGFRTVRGDLITGSLKGKEVPTGEFLRFDAAPRDRAEGPIAPAKGQTIEMVVAEDDVLSLREAGHRFDLAEFPTVSDGSPFLFGPGSFKGDLVDYIRSRFLFYRGGMNYTFYTPNATVPGEVQITRNGEGFGSVMKIWIPAVSPSASINIPFFNAAGVGQNFMVDTGGDIQQTYSLTPFGTGNLTLKVARSLGDDFSCGVSTICPMISN